MVGPVWALGVKPVMGTALPLTPRWMTLLYVPRRVANSVFNANGRIAWQFDSIFTATEIQSRLVSGSPNASILLVEVHYNYHRVLGLPWLAI